MKKTTFSRALVLLTGWLASCGGGAGKQDETPVLQRPVSGSYVCSVSRDATSYAPKAWSNLVALQGVTGGTTFLARAEWASDNYDLAHHAFVVSSLGLDGTLGAPMTIPVESPDAIAAVSAAPLGQGFALVWADAQALTFAAFDEEGAMLGQPKVVTTLDRNPDSTIQVHLATGPSGSGFAVALSMRRGVEPIEPHVLFLDANGTARGPLRRLGTPPDDPALYSDPSPDVLATEEGYVFVWSDTSADAAHLFFSRTDAVGTETVAPKIVASTTGTKLHYNNAGFGAGRMRLAEIANGFIAAWSESYWGDPDPGGFSPGKGAWAVLRLALLDAQGTPTGPGATLREPENDVDEVDPVLTPFGNALGVAWSRGSHIYICAGCIPDHRIDFVLIDPQSLTPLSNVVTVTNGGASRAGGLLGKQVEAIGSSFLTLYDRVFHTTAEPGSAVFTCTR